MLLKLPHFLRPTCTLPFLEPFFDPVIIISSIGLLQIKFPIIASKCMVAIKCHASCIYGPQHEKTCLQRFANNTGADQPAHPRSLISTFVIRFLGSDICKLATSEISIFLLASVAKETGLKLALTEIPNYHWYTIA